MGYTGTENGVNDRICSFHVGEFENRVRPRNISRLNRALRHVLHNLETIFQFRW